MSYQPKVYREQGGASLVIAEGGSIKLPVITRTADYTVPASESGHTYLTGAVDLKFTLLPTEAGLRYRFIVKTPSTGTGLQIDPADADAIHGNGLTSVGDKDRINTSATDAAGDLVEQVGDSVDGWWITSIVGTWAKET